MNNNEHHNISSFENESTHHPPWNPSPEINPQGYLSSLYRRIPGTWESSLKQSLIHSPSSRNSLNRPVVVRQVPGDGNCLFHSIAICLSSAETGKQLPMDDEASLMELKQMSHNLRTRAVECLNQRPNNNGVTSSSIKKRGLRKLFIQGRETLPTHHLVEAAASQYGISGEEYCELMAQDSYWGGGPEIVALCNVLKRPIHVYELVDSRDVDVGREGVMRMVGGNSNDACGHFGCVHCGGSAFSPPSANNEKIKSTPKTRRRPTINQDFYLRRMATFGSPKFDSKEPLHILSADSRFPDVNPSCMLANGNHFLALFPVTSTRRAKTDGRRIGYSPRVRGGAASDGSSQDCCSMERESHDESEWVFPECDNYYEPSFSKSNGDGDTHNNQWCHRVFRKRNLLPRYHKQSADSIKRLVGICIKLSLRILAHTGF